MKIIINNDDFVIYIIKSNFDFKSITKEEIEQNIKKTLLHIKKKYYKSISGFYNVNLYNNNRYGYILEINKQSELDFFPDLVDIKLKIYDEIKIFLKFDDYFLISNKSDVYYYNENYYIDINKLNAKDIDILSEFYSIIYGKELESIFNKLKLVLN